MRRQLVPSKPTYRGVLIENRSLALSFPLVDNVSEVYWDQRVDGPLSVVRI
jgi:uncharacterized protein Usg